MGTQDSTYNNTSGHYDECPQHTDPSSPLCYCEGIIAAQDAYYTEPSNSEH
ncbi:hypothetical protein [Streptomyces sp. NPDC096095]|uniref:hypothetical protein n=1 Tax=Streptomyces sp. NPDC096095 TaxID=3155545 RepID=UPI00331B7134